VCIAFQTTMRPWISIAGIVLIVQLSLVFCQETNPLLEVVDRQRFQELPICPETIKTFSEQFCQCEIRQGCTALPPFRDGLTINGIELPGRTISALDIARNLVDESIIDVLSAEIKGPGVGVGIMDAANSCHMVSEIYGYTETIVVTSGTVQRSTFTTNDPGNQGSTDNVQRDQVPTYIAPEIEGANDCSELSMQILVKDINQAANLRVSLQYMFLSEEYPEFVGNIFNDQFRFLLRESGTTGPFTNLATIGSVDVAINTVNYDPEFAALFRLCTPDTVYDGHTVNLFSTPETLQVGKQYDVRMVVCDVGDGQYDSAVFMKKGSLAVCDAAPTGIDCPGAIEICPGAPVPEAVPEGTCDNNLQVDLATPVDTTVLGTILGVTYFIVDYPNITCEFDLTVANREPTLYNPPGTSLISWGNGSTWDGVSEPAPVFEIGDVITLNFTLEDDCCETGNNGTITVNGEVILSFTWVSGDTISVDIPITNLFSQTETITIALYDCFGALTLKIVKITIDKPCPSGLPTVFVSGGLQPFYEIGDVVRFGFFLADFEETASWEMFVNGAPTDPPTTGNTTGFIQVPITVTKCGEFEVTFNFDNLCTGDLVLDAFVVVVCQPSPTPVPSEAPTATPSPVATPNPCPEEGFELNPATGLCEKTCTTAADCVHSGVCSDVCSPSGFCTDGRGSCRLGCCKATPGNIPLTLSDAICSNGCGKTSCCFENISGGCNSLNDPEGLENTCTALYGKKVPCSPETESVDCAGLGIERCILVKNANINDSYCSASCTPTTGCADGYRCVQFTKSYNTVPAIYGGSQMYFCVPEALTP